MLFRSERRVVGLNQFKIIPMEFIVDKDLKIRQFFENWLQYIVNYNDNGNYNAIGYDVQEIRLYIPSLHSYNNSKTDGEFIIIHSSNTGSNPLLVCIPIKSNNTTSVSSLFFQTLIDSGEISIEEVKNHPQKSLLLQAIDGSENLNLQEIQIDVQDGDKLLLCTDGLTNVVDESEIENIINSFENVGAVSALIEKSLELGGPDNITVIVTEITNQKIENKICPYIISIIFFGNIHGSHSI